MTPSPRERSSVAALGTDVFGPRRRSDGNRAGCGGGLAAVLAIASLTTGCWTGSGGPAAAPSTTVAPITVSTDAPAEVAGISVERAAVAPDQADPTATTTVPVTTPATTIPPVAPVAAPAVTPAPPTAPTTTVPPLRDQVLAAISFPWQQHLPGWRIEFLPERPGYRGSTFPGEKVIRIYQRDGLTLADYVHVAAHEIGHALDVTLLDDDDHGRWNEARGRRADAGWWVASGADDFSSGAGDWAECFAWSQLPSGRFYSKVAGIPTDAQLLVMADLLA